MPSVAKKPGVTKRRLARSGCRRASAGSPVERRPARCRRASTIGRQLMYAGVGHAGQRARRSEDARVERFARRDVAVLAASAAASAASARRRTRKPDRVAWIVHSARISRPAETSSTTDATISATTSAERSAPCGRRPRARLRAARRRSAFAADAQHRRQAERDAGERGQHSGEQQHAHVDRRRRSRSAAWSAPAAPAAAPPRQATATPSAPPTAASSRLSVISWRTSRSRPAPIAVRTASSRRRRARAPAAGWRGSRRRSAARTRPRRRAR